MKWLLLVTAMTANGEGELYPYTIARVMESYKECTIVADKAITMDRVEFATCVKMEYLRESGRSYNTE